MANLSRYRNGNYSGYNSSEAVLAAVEEIAGGELPTDGEDDDWIVQRVTQNYPGGDCPKSRACRLWYLPTDAEMQAVERRAWELADADDDRLFWGQHTLHRQPA